MKIQNNHIVIQSKYFGNAKTNSENKKVDNNFGEKSVNVTISKEGTEKLRQSLMQLENYNPNHSKEMEENWRLLEERPKNILHTTQTCSISLEEIEKPNKDKEAEQKNSYTSDGKILIKYIAENTLEAYAKYYDEIVKGYEDGTREFYIYDKNSELGYRRLTMEEELEALDKNYEEVVEYSDDYYRESREKEIEVVKGFVRMWAGIPGEKAKAQYEALKMYSDELENNKEIIPENMTEIMTSAKENFKNQYWGSKETGTSIKEILATIKLW